MFYEILPDKEIGLLRNPLVNRGKFLMTFNFNYLLTNYVCYYILHKFLLLFCLFVCWTNPSILSNIDSHARGLECCAV